MNKTALHRFVAMLVVVALLTGCAAGAQPTPASAAQIPVVRGASQVVAEGRLLPATSADLAFITSGRVAEVLVQEGQAVSPGDVLIRLDDLRANAAIAEAEAGLRAAEAELARLKAGPRPERVRAAQAAVSSAQAAVDTAEAQLENVRTGVALAEGQIAQAQATLRDVAAGATARERRIAELNIERARNELWGAQAYRDGVGGAVDRGQTSSAELDKAEAQIGVAYVGQQIAEEELAALGDGARPGAVSQARAAVQIAEAQKVQAESQIPVAESEVQARQAALAQAQAEAELAKLTATAEEIAVAEAAVAQAAASVESAKASLEDLVLRAPIAGSVAFLDAKAGEQITAGQVVVTLGQTGDWVIETDDLTEMEIVRITQGQGVAIVPDAVPNLELRGTVEAIRPLYEIKRGDTTYTVRIRPANSDNRLRWGMKVIVTFKD